MKSPNSNTSLSTDQSKLSQQNVLERVADRSTKKTFFKRTWSQFMFRKKCNRLKCYQSSHLKMVEYCRKKCKQTNLKNISKIII